MSREQWGSGYWRGIEDARRGNYGSYSEKAKQCADSIILSIIDYEEKKDDREVKTLNQIINIFVLSEFYGGEDRKAIHSAFNYIWHEQPYGFYIGGDNGGQLDYKNDCLIVANI